MCSKFYSPVLSCTAAPLHSPTSAPNGGFWDFLASVCGEGHPPHTGRVWAKCGSESDVIHFFGFFSKSESVLIHFGGPRAYFAQSLRIGLIISSLPCCIVILCNPLEYTFRREKRARRTLPILVRPSGLFLYFLCFIRAWGYTFLANLDGNSIKIK